MPGIGPKYEQKLRASLAQDLSRPPAHALLLNRALALTHEIAESLGAEPAGDARRFRDRCEQLAVVAPAEEPADTIRRFEALPQIVALVEREDRRAVGVTVEGVPVELLVPAPGRGRYRADPRDRRGGVRRGARAAAGRRDRARGLRRPGHPLVPAGAPRGAIPRRAAAARRPP